MNTTGYLHCNAVWLKLSRSPSVTPAQALVCGLSDVCRRVGASFLLRPCLLPEPRLLESTWLAKLRGASISKSSIPVSGIPSLLRSEPVRECRVRSRNWPGRLYPRRCRPRPAAVCGAQGQQYIRRTPGPSETPTASPPRAGVGSRRRITSGSPSWEPGSFQS